MATKNLSDYDITKVPDASNMIFGVVVAEWNPEITGAPLLRGLLHYLQKPNLVLKLLVDNQLTTLGLVSDTVFGPVNKKMELAG